MAYEENKISFQKSNSFWGSVKNFFAGIWKAFFSIFFGCGCLVFLAAAGLCALIILSLCSDETPSAFRKKGPTKFSEKYVSGDPDSGNKIAVVDVIGVITADNSGSIREYACSDQICEQLDAAEADHSVKAVIINLNTPGGEVTASDEIYHRILKLRKTKPVIAMMNSLCASGGYYVAAACSPIIAHHLTLTGSIGVIISTYNYKGLFDKLGLQSEVYTSGRMKDMLNGARLRTAEEIAVTHTLVMNTYQEFVNIVSRSRGIPADTIRNTEIGDGRIFDGGQALKLKLVDSLGYFENAVEAAAKEAKIRNYLVFRYESKFDFTRILEEFSSKVPPAQLILSPAKAGFQPKPGILYFLPANY